MSNDLTDPDYWNSTHTAPLRPSDDRMRWLGQRVQWRYNRMLSQLISTVDGGHILEIGCAPGNILERIHRLRPQYQLHGIDYSQEGIELTRQKLRAASIEATVHQGDVRHFSAPRKYGIVFSAGFIEHFRDPIDLIRHHVRLAAPGGLVSLYVPNYAAPVVQSLIRRFDPQALSTHNLGIMNKMALMEAMLEAGLEQVIVGSAGGPRVRAACNPMNFFGQLYMLIARAYNLSTVVLPVEGMFWDAFIWGQGVVRL